MLTREEDMDARAVRRQGWTISAIARHLGRYRKTIRAYLNGEQETGQRRQAPDAFLPYLDYCRQRLTDDPHLWASALFDEVVELGYEGRSRGVYLLELLGGASRLLDPRRAPEPACRCLQ